jgi:hypothetical protein
MRYVDPTPDSRADHAVSAIIRFVGDLSSHGTGM